MVDFNLNRYSQLIPFAMVSHEEQSVENLRIELVSSIAIGIIVSLPFAVVGSFLSSFCCIFSGAVFVNNITDSEVSRVFAGVISGLYGAVLGYHYCAEFVSQKAEEVVKAKITDLRSIDRAEEVARAFGNIFLDVASDFGFGSGNFLLEQPEYRVHDKEPIYRMFTMLSAAKGSLEGKIQGLYVGWSEGYQMGAQTGGLNGASILKDLEQNVTFSTRLFQSSQEVGERIAGELIERMSAQLNTIAV